uniref:Uncharacterized protein n=1 Tax=Arundo donax TaxID=35708 RepID=A0A0A9N0G9_ARUDO
MNRHSTVLNSIQDVLSGDHLIPLCQGIFGKVGRYLRVKVFTWLALWRRHCTADHRERHGLRCHYLCKLCDQEPGTTGHFLSILSFTKHILWNILLFRHCWHLPSSHKNLQD